MNPIQKITLLLVIMIGIVILGSMFLYPVQRQDQLQADEQAVRALLEDSVLPDVLEIDSLEMTNDTTYKVTGMIVRFSTEGGGIGEIPTEASRQSVSFTVVKTNEEFSITETARGPINGVGGNWVYSEPDARGVQFMYPEQLSTSYVSAAQWPPTVSLAGGDYACEAGEKTLEGGTVMKYETRLVGDREYCVGTTSEGAAGSTYVTYDYQTKQGDFIARAEFALRFPQCLNYDDPQRTACTTEQSGFSVDGLADRIVSSIRMN